MKFKSLTLAITALFFLGIALSSCTKEGPTGPAGADGKDGKDGAATCGDCHNLSTDLYAKIVQYEASTHATGFTFFEQRTTCAPCHTHEGFMERMERDSVATLLAVEDPTPVNCRTCHNIHKTYTAADYGFTFDDPARNWLDATKNFDMGKANICANCHQARPLSPVPVPGGADVTITSSRWGYHHGPVYNMIIGEGGYRTAGGNYATPTASHKNDVENGCVDCHMAAAQGDMAGGHTFNTFMEEEGTPNIVACTPCHPGVTNFDINGVQTEIADLLDSLQTILTTLNIYNPANGLMKTGTYTADKAGAYLNWQFVTEDRSLGVHNYEYAKALLTNSIDAVNKK